MRVQLKRSKREILNRDTTLKALQRNYEALAAVLRSVICLFWAMQLACCVLGNAVGMTIEADDCTQVHEEGKTEHQRRKTAFDQLSDRYSETQMKLDKTEGTMRSLHDTIAKLELKCKTQVAHDFHTRHTN